MNNYFGFSVKQVAAFGVLKIRIMVFLGDPHLQRAPRHAFTDLLSGPSTLSQLGRSFDLVSLPTVLNNPYDKPHHPSSHEILQERVQQSNSWVLRLLVAIITVNT